tara:strand:+ start:401 stop:589 length:189 start_codon:yes stop_codon:yes gene_type:complete
VQLKVGDLVKYKPTTDYEDIFLGLVVETGVYAGRKDIKVYWSALNEAATEFSKYLEVVSESR